MRCFATAPRVSLVTRRWASTKADLTDEKLLEQIQNRLGSAAHVDLESKTVSTASGDLPMSPLLDPAWIRARRRTRKEKPGKPEGRMAKKMRMNPYARALASPIRMCGITKTYLPRFFLQDFEIVNHPEKDELWMAPGAEAIDKVQPTYKGGQVEAEDEASGTVEADDAATRSGRGPAPVRFYVLGRKEILDPIDEQPSRRAVMLGARSGTAYDANMRRAEWKKDTGALWLDVMRRTVCETLITRAKRNTKNQCSRFMAPIARFEDVAKEGSRESILWLPEVAPTSDDPASTSSGPEYTTYDIDGANYYKKVPVYNLHQLLGAAEVARLKSGAPKIFGQHELVVLKRFGSHSMIKLHQLLWRLQGYLRETPGKLETGPAR